MGPCGAQFLPFSLPLFFFFSSLFSFFRFFFYKRLRFIGQEPSQFEYMTLPSGQSEISQSATSIRQIDR